MRHEVVTMIVSAVALGVSMVVLYHRDALPTLLSTAVEDVRPQPAVTGALHVVGSVSTLHLAEPWAEMFQTYYPGLQVHVHSIEAARTPPWWQLTEQPLVAILSEPMRDDEVGDFQRQWGYKPTRQPAALSAVVFIVHPSNPIATQGLSIPVLRTLFSQPHSPSHKPLAVWGDLGLHGMWRQLPITMHGHDASAALFVEVRQRVLNDGLFKAEVNRHPSSADVISAVSRDAGAIGYIDLSVVTPAVKVLPLAQNSKQPAIAPSSANLRNQRYPLPRVVYLYLNRHPKRPLDAPRRALIRFIYSDEGQHIAAKRGYTSLSASMAHQVLQNLLTSPAKDGEPEPPPRGG